MSKKDNIMYESDKDNFDEKAINKFVGRIIGDFKASGKNNLIIVNVGTTRCNGDAIAPFIGTLVEGKCNNIKIYGTLNDNVHYLSDDKIIEIKETHKGDYIVVVGSSIGNVENVGKIKLLRRTFEMGRGTGKTKKKIGDICLCVVPSYDYDSLISVRFRDMFEMANNISQIIIKLNEKLK